MNGCSANITLASTTGDVDENGHGIGAQEIRAQLKTVLPHEERERQKQSCDYLMHLRCTDFPDKLTWEVVHVCRRFR